MSPEVVTLSDAILVCIVVTCLIALCSKLLDPRRKLDRVVFGGVLIMMLVSYIYYRYTQTLPEFEWTAYAVWPRVYLTFETVVIVYTLLSIIFFFRRSDHTAAADASEAKICSIESAPGVDVFICTYNEEKFILERTILAAKAIDYSNFTIWVLDDGRREWLRDYCAEMGVNHVGREDNKGAKGGNINNGLRVSAATTNAPFILILDADFAPQRKILKRIVGQFDDKRIGVVQTPQFYYNADPIQHNLLASQSWVDDQRIFFDIMQPSKDAWGAAFCVGTSCVVRRDALDLIGGMPQETVTEDIHLTYRLLQKGLLTRWLNERLSVGLSAESLSGYITQRCRWCLGTVQVALLRDGPFFGGGYTLMQRLHYLHGLIFWFCRPFVLLLLAAPILYYFLGLPAILMEPSAFFLYALPMVGGMWIFHAWVSESRSLPLFTEVSQMVSAVPITFALMHALVQPFGRPFKVTAKGEDRSRVQIMVQLAVMFALVIVLTFIGMLNGPLLSLNNDLDSFSIVWGTIVMIYAFVAMMVCIELPRRPADDAGFRMDRDVTASTEGGMRLDARIVEIWADRTQVAFSAKVFEDLAIGENLRFSPFEGTELVGRIASKIIATKEIVLDSVALQAEGHASVDDPADIRRIMTTCLFSSAPVNIAERASMAGALGALSRRLFGSPEKVLREAG